MDKNINIGDLIPQRHPFILVDKLISCHDKLIESSFRIPENHSMVTNGKLCEGGLIENIAQTAAAGNGYEAKEKGQDIPKGFIAGIKNIRIKRLPEINSLLSTKVILQCRIMGYDLIKGEVFEREEIIVRCEMKIYCPE